MPGSSSNSGEFEPEATSIPPTTVPSLGRALGLLGLVLFAFADGGSASRVPHFTGVRLLLLFVEHLRGHNDLPLVQFAKGNLTGAVRTLEDALWIGLLAAIPVACAALVLLPRRRFPRAASALAVVGATAASAVLVCLRFEAPDNGLKNASELSDLLVAWLPAACVIAVGISALLRTFKGTRGGRPLLGLILIVPSCVALLPRAVLAPAHHALAWGSFAFAPLLAAAAIAELTRVETARTRRLERGARIVAALVLLFTADLVARALRPRSARDSWRSRPGFVDVLRPAQGSPVVAVAFSPDGKTLASATFEGSVDLWDVDSGRFVRHLGDRGAGWTYLRLAFSPSGQLAVAGLRGAATPELVTLLDPRTGETTGAFFGTSTGRGSGGTGYAVELAYSRDGERLALTRYSDSLHGPGLLDVWASDGRSLAALEIATPVQAVAMDPARDLVAIECDARSEADGGRLLVVLSRPGLGWLPVSATVDASFVGAAPMRFGRHELLVASGGVIAFEPSSLGTPERRLDLVRFPDVKHEGEPPRETLSRDGAWWVVSNGSTIVAAPTTRDGFQRTRVGHVVGGPVTGHAIAISDDGRVVAVAGESLDSAPTLVTLEDAG